MNSLLCPDVSNAVLNHVVSVLNDALKRDPEGITALMNSRVPVNSKIIEHPTIQVSAGNVLGPLGLLNGLFGVNHSGSGFIVMVLNEQNKILEFRINDCT